MAIKVDDIEKVTVRIFDYGNNPKIEKDDSVDYFFNPQHRDGNPNKSQWTILCSEELDCFRNSWKKYWNGIVDGIDDGDEVKVDYETGKIYNLTKNTEYQGQPFPPFMQKIIEQGGLVNYVNNKKG